MDYRVEGVRHRGCGKKDCQFQQLQKEDAVDCNKWMKLVRPKRY